MSEYFTNIAVHMANKAGQEKKKKKQTKIETVEQLSLKAY